MIYKDDTNSLYDRFDSILEFLTSPYDSFVDFGCGPAPHTRNLKCRDKLFVDMVETEDRPQPFLKMDQKEYFQTMKSRPDVIIGLDFIEHLPKEEGYKFLIKAISNSKLVILFTPEGEYHIPGAEGPDQHQCGWTAEEFDELGFQVWLSPNFHPTLKEGGLGAFLAWKHRSGDLVPVDVLFYSFKFYMENKK